MSELTAYSEYQNAKSTIQSHLETMKTVAGEAGLDENSIKIVFT